MGFIDRNLTANEKILYRGQLHWLAFWKPVVLSLLVTLLTWAGCWYIHTDRQSSTPLYLAAIATILYFIIAIVWVNLLKVNREYIVTNMRVILKTGIINRDLLELRLEKCEGLKIKQSILQRILNYGTIVITTGDVENYFTFLRNPLEFRRRVNEAIDKYNLSKTGQR